MTDVVADKAADLNPLTPRAPESAVPEEVPRITNETIAEHREDVLSGARKYIYHRQVPLGKIVLTHDDISKREVRCSIGRSHCPP